jgi:hypothetical protein
VRRELQRSREFLPSIAPALAWEAIEYAHTFEYIRHLLREPKPVLDVIHWLGHVPSFGLLLIGIGWQLTRHFRRFSAVASAEHQNEPKVAEFVRERTVTTTTTVSEREVVYRRET